MAAIFRKSIPRLSATRIVKPQFQRWQSTYSHLETEMTARKIRPIFDDLTPQNSFRLNVSLADFLPETSAPLIPPAPNDPQPMPLPHHLLYFEPAKPPSSLLPDGTNPDQSPGEPFVRRMWAGGSVLYNPNSPLLLSSQRAVCAEYIRNVSLKGASGSEKVFVGIERRIASLTTSEASSLASANNDPKAIYDIEDTIRQRLWKPSDTDFGDANIIERRNIVFMRERTPTEAAAAVAAAKTPGKMLKPQHSPDYEHTLHPDAQLLFRYSALTFNAHSIHLDTQYCQQVEGHKHLLVHGPLSFTLLLTLLQQRLGKEANGEVVRSVEYRNLAPLYAYDPLKICGRRVDEGKWEVWAETPEGGIAVKGTVRTEKI